MKRRCASLVFALASITMSPNVGQANSGDFNGGVAIGSSYAGVDTAPTNGMIVQGIAGIGTASPVAGLDVQNGITSASGVAYAVRYQQTLTASANSDTLTALYINPTFTNGSYTGVANNGLIVVSGNVGIGTTSPGALLDVNGSAIVGATAQYSAGGNTGIVQVNSSSTSSNGPQVNLIGWGNQAGYGGSFGAYHSRGGAVGTQGALQSGDSLGNVAFGGSDGNSVGFSALVSGFTGSTWTTSNHEAYLAFYTSPNGSAADTVSEQMRITSAGNVGIGTTAPLAPLDVRGAVGNTVAMFGYNTTGVSIIESWPNVYFNAYYNSGPLFMGSGYAGAVNLIPTTGDMAFLVSNASGTAGGAVTFNTPMYIKNNGNVGIGTNAPAQALEVNGKVKIDSFASAASTTVCENGNVLSSCSSSIRYKERVAPAPFGLKEIMEMRPIIFKWKDRDEDDFGLIAEDMEKINPLFVTYERGQIEGVKYPQLTAVLINAVQQQQEQFVDQQMQLHEQQMEIDQLRRIVAKLNHVN